MACDTPVIAAVEGLAIGTGTSLLLHCDSVIAGRSARFKTAFVDLGLVPEAVSTVIMPLHLGSRRAADLLLMGETLNGEEARECGLVSRAVDDGQAVEEVREALERERTVFAERLRSEDCRAALTRMEKR